METKSLPEYEDDNLGHRYMTLWHIDSRQNASFEVLAANGGLMKGRVDFNWDFSRKHKEIIPYRYYLETLVDGERRAALFDFMYKKEAPDRSLLTYINMGKEVKINKAPDSDSYTIEFDATTKQREHRNEVWTNTGIVEIGLYYAPNHGWETVKLNPNGSSSTNNNIHITINADDFRDIMLCGVNDKQQLAAFRFCRDLPVLTPTKYWQSQTMGGDRMFAQLHNNTDLIVGVAGRAEAYFKELYWKHVE